MAKRTARQRAAEIDEKGFRATQMQLAGYTLREIARDVGYSSHSGAAQAISRYKRRTQIMPIQEAMQTTLARLECLLKVMWPGALAGNYRDFDRVLRVIIQQSKLLNLNGRDLLDFETEIREFAQNSGLDPEETLKLAESLADARTR